MRFGGALLAGIVFAFGTFFVVWLPWPLTNIFPLHAVAAARDRAAGPAARAAAGGGLAALVALQFFGGHPETSFHCHGRRRRLLRVRG